MTSDITRRGFATLVLSGASIAVLAACGRGDGGSGSGSGSASGGGAGTIADKATGTIEIWAAAGNGDTLKKLAETFKKDNPDVTIKVTEIPWGDIITKNQTAVAGGTGPDIVMTGADQTATVIAMGGLAQLPDGVFAEKDFYPAAVASVTGKDGMYAVPWYVETRFLFYRKDIAEQLGKKAPTTWDELVELSGAYKNRPGGQFGIIMPRPIENPAQVIVPFTSNAGGSVIKDDKWTIDTPEFIEAMDFYKGFFERGESPQSDTEAKFENGGAPMMISGPWMVQVFDEMIQTGAAAADFTKDSVGFVPMPKGPKNNNSYIGGGNLGVFASSKNKESSFKFLQWLLEDAQQKAIFDINNNFPSRISSADYQGITDSPVMSVLKEQMPNTVETPSYPSWQQIAAEIGTNAERVAFGKISSADAAKAIQTKADSVGLGW